VHLFVELGAQGHAEIVGLHRLVGLVVVVELGDLCQRKIVEAHVDSVVQDRKILKLLHLSGRVRLAAQRFAELILSHADLEVGRVCFFSRQRLSEIFWHVHYFAGLAKRQLVVVELQLALARDKGLHLDLDRLVLPESARGNAWQVEALRHCAFDAGRRGLALWNTRHGKQGFMVKKVTLRAESSKEMQCNAGKVQQKQQQRYLQLAALRP
jgi:hypothetical protein